MEKIEDIPEFHAQTRKWPETVPADPLARPGFATWRDIARPGVRPLQPRPPASTRPEQHTSGPSHLRAQPTSLRATHLVQTHPFWWPDCLTRARLMHCLGAFLGLFKPKCKVLEPVQCKFGGFPAGSSFLGALMYFTKFLL